jgi:hypothetical protein
MLSVKVGLVDTTKTIDTQTMAAAAAALNIQVTRDLPQFWPVNASVSYLTDPHHIPQGVWPIQLVKSLPPGEGGFHMTKHNQPYAKVIITPGSNEWVVDASHETIEMLVDPNGNRLQTSLAIEIVGGKIVDGTGSFEYLVEACDPCEADDFTYDINGLRVSDFITPHFYDPTATPGTRYSFTGAITRPREILEGGYISWVDPTTNDMQQILWVDPNQPPQLNNLGPATQMGHSLREAVERATFKNVYPMRRPAAPAVREARAARRDALAAAAEVRAKNYV